MWSGDKVDILTLLATGHVCQMRWRRESRATANGGRFLLTFQRFKSAEPGQEVEVPGL